MCAYVCVCVWWFGLSVWVSSNITSVIHTHAHPQTETRWYTILSLPCIHAHTRTHTHTHSFHFWRIGRFLRAAGPTGKKCLDKLKTHTRVCIQTHNGTFSTHNVDFVLLSRALLSARRPSEAAFPCRTPSGSGTRRFRGACVMSTQGWRGLDFNQKLKTKWS